MARLSDNIESFIKELMSDAPLLEVRRNELAQHFGCAPSQINYVLATRFTLDHGYIIESRRGGGGYIRIERLTQKQDRNLLDVLLSRIGNSIDMETAVAIISHLSDLEIITDNEARLMRAAVSSNAVALPLAAKDIMRASVLAGMVLQVFRNLEGGRV